MDWVKKPGLHIFLVLMAIAVAVMAQPSWPARGQEFLLVLFACAALSVERG